MKAKVGDRVRIIRRYYGHQFKIGESVRITLVNYNHNYYEGYNTAGEKYAFRDDEIKLFDNYRYSKRDSKGRFVKSIKCQICGVDESDSIKEGRGEIYACVYPCAFVPDVLCSKCHNWAAKLGLEK